MQEHSQISKKPTIERGNEFVTVYSVADDALAECQRLLDGIAVFPRYRNGDFVRDYQLNGKWLRGYYK